MRTVTILFVRFCRPASSLDAFFIIIFYCSVSIVQVRADPLNIGELSALLGELLLFVCQRWTYKKG